MYIGDEICINIYKEGEIYIKGAKYMKKTKIYINIYKEQIYTK